MPTERSVAEVEELKALFTEASVLISTDYRGMNVAAMNLFRRALRNGGIKYRISKNTLASIAADEIGRPEIKDLVVGPVGWVYTDADPSAAAKSLVDHIQAERLDMVIHGALMGDQMLSREQVEALARLPGREQLLAMLFSQMNAPVAGLATVLAGSIRGLATVLQRISELEGAADGEAPAGEPDAAAGDAGADGEASAGEPDAAAGDAGADEEASADEPDAAAGDAEADEEASAGEPDAVAGDAEADEEASAGEPDAEKDALVEEPSGKAEEGTEDRSEGEAGEDED